MPTKGTRGQKGLELAHPSQRLIRAFRELEEAAGGRDGLVARLSHGAASKEQEYLLGLIADPDNDARSLATICGMARVSVGHFIQMLKESGLARAQLAAIDKVSELLPQVAQSVMEQALPHFRRCPSCRGTKRIRTKSKDPETKQWVEEEEECGACDEEGMVEVMPTHEREKTALEIGGLLKRGGSINIQQGVQVKTTLGGGSAKTSSNFRTLTDQLMYGKFETKEEEAVEAEVVEVREDGSAGEES